MIHRWFGNSLDHVVLLRVTEYVPGNCKGKAFYQRQVSLFRHYPAPLKNLVADVDFHWADFSTGSAQGGVERQFAVFEFVERGVEDDPDRTGVGRAIS